MNFLECGPLTSKSALLLAHGAGAPMDSTFMAAISERLAGLDIRVLRFEFAYMAERRTKSGKRPPPPVARLLPEFIEAAKLAKSRLPAGTQLAVGGKSMGGRIASMVADGLLADGTANALICFGYPFHPPDQPDKLRTAHLGALRTPTLIVQGVRDPLGSQAEVAALTALSPSIRFCWIADGDHDLAPHVRSGLTQADSLSAAAQAVAEFLAGV